MKMSRATAMAACFVLCVGAGAGAASGQDTERPPAAPERPAEPFLDGIVDQLLSTLRGLLQAIPQYEMPQIDENGDIIIRRKRPEPERDHSELEAVET